MAKKITGFVKLQIPAGKATPAPHFARTEVMPAKKAEPKANKIHI